MKAKPTYESPAVIRQAYLSREAVMLQASVVDQIEAIETMGQDVEEKDFSGSTFNHTWGEY